MPKVYLTESQRRLDRIYDHIYLQMRKQKIRQKHIAAELGVTQEAVSKMLSNKTLTLEAFITILGMFGEDATSCIK